MESTRWHYSDEPKRKLREGNSISFCVCHRNANPEFETLLVAMFRCVLQLTPVNERFSDWRLWSLITGQLFLKVAFSATRHQV